MYLRARGIEYIGVHGAFYAPEDWRRIQAGARRARRPRPRDHRALEWVRVAPLPPATIAGPMSPIHHRHLGRRTSALQAEAQD